MNIQRVIVILLMCTLCTYMAKAKLMLSPLFTDHAVLQQGKQIPVWGWGEVADSITVSLGNTILTTTVGSDGRWMLRLPAMQADGVPYELVVSGGSEVIRCSDVYVGEVWFASGQSNMEWTLHAGVLNKESEVASAHYPLIRYYKVPVGTAAQPQEQLAGDAQWTVASPITVASFSAVSYFFARRIHLDKAVPVGIINASRGATDIETWMSREALEAVPFMHESLNKRVTDSARWNAYVDSIHQAEHQREEVARTSDIGLRTNVHSLGYDDSAWMSAYYPLDMPKMGAPGFWGLMWVRTSFDLPARLSGKKAELLLPLLNRDDRVYINGVEVARSVYRTGRVEVPAFTLRTGSNVLAVRMYVHWGDASIGRNGNVCEIRFIDGSIVQLHGVWRCNKDIEPRVAQWNNYYCRPTVSFNAMVAPVIPYAVRGFLWYQGENNASKGEQYKVLQPRMTDDWRVKWGAGYLPFLYVQLAGFQKRSEEPRTVDEWAQFRYAQYRCESLCYNSAMASAVDLGDADNIHPPNKQGVAERLYLLARRLAYGEEVCATGPKLRSCLRKGDMLVLTFDVGSGSLCQKEGASSFAVIDASGKGHWVKAELKGNQVLIDCSGIVLAQKVQYAWQSNPESTLYDSNNLPAIPFFVEITP